MRESERTDERMATAGDEAERRVLREVESSVLAFSESSSVAHSCDYRTNMPRTPFNAASVRSHSALVGNRVCREAMDRYRQC